MSDFVDPRTAHVQMLFIQHTSPLRGFIIARMPDFSPVDDVLRETFLTITKKAASFEPGSKFIGWACTIARFKVPEADDDRLGVMADCLQQLAPQSRRAIELRYHHAPKPAELGNWSPNAEGDGRPIRNLHGRMDEV